LVEVSLRPDHAPVNLYQLHMSPSVHLYVPK
jgi:hypothetical protein